MTPKAPATKEKKDWVDFIKTAPKDTIKTEKTIHRKGENICKSFI